MFNFALGKLGAAIKAGTGSAGVVPLFSRDYEATGSLGADATFTRASTATYVDSNGVIQTAAINTPRFDYSTGSRALLMEPAATNYLLNSITPATQTTGSLGTGNYVLWVEGAGSAAVTAGTATITGGGTATDGTPDTFTVTGAGTVTVTVTGTLDRFQLELGTTPTSHIPTSGSTVTRAADALSYPLTTPQTEGMLIGQWAFRAGVPLTAAHGFVSFRSASRTSVLYKLTDGNVFAYDGASASVAAAVFTGTEESVALAVRWGSGGHVVGGKPDAGSWTWDDTPASYDGEWTTENIVNLFVQPGFPVGITKVEIYDVDQGADWIEANY